MYAQGPQIGTRRSVYPPEDGVTGRPSLWIAEDFGCCASRPMVETIESLQSALFGKGLVERTKIDHNSLVRSAANLLTAVACRHFEVIRFPSTLTTSAVARTSWPTGVAAKCFTSTAVPTALSPASKNGLIALSAAFSIIRIITGVASTCGNMASLNRLARCSACTRNADVPLAPNGIRRISFALYST